MCVYILFICIAAIILSHNKHYSPKVTFLLHSVVQLEQPFHIFLWQCFREKSFFFCIYLCAFVCALEVASLNAALLSLCGWLLSLLFAPPLPAFLPFYLPRPKQITETQKIPGEAEINAAVICKQSQQMHKGESPPIGDERERPPPEDDIEEAAVVIHASSCFHWLSLVWLLCGPSAEQYLSLQGCFTESHFNHYFVWFSVNKSVSVCHFEYESLLGL